MGPYEGLLLAEADTWWKKICPSPLKKNLLPWKLTAVPWKINGWKMYSLLKIVPFWGHVSFQGCIRTKFQKKSSNQLEPKVADRDKSARIFMQRIKATDGTQAGPLGYWKTETIGRSHHRFRMVKIPWNFICQMPMPKTAIKGSRKYMHGSTYRSWNSWNLS